MQQERYGCLTDHADSLNPILLWPVLYLAGYNIQAAIGLTQLSRPESDTESFRALMIMDSNPFYKHI